MDRLAVSVKVPDPELDQTPLVAKFTAPLTCIESSSVHKMSSPPVVRLGPGLIVIITVSRPIKQDQLETVDKICSTNPAVISFA